MLSGTVSAVAADVDQYSMPPRSQPLASGLFETSALTLTNDRGDITWDGGCLLHTRHTTRSSLLRHRPVDLDHTKRATE
jgi:hypothetical protein